MKIDIKIEASPEELMSEFGLDYGFTGKDLQKVGKVFSEKFCVDLEIYAIETMCGKHIGPSSRIIKIDLQSKARC